jgi:hypothetical protein
VVPDIFAPYLSEYAAGLECGSLWEQWVEEMTASLAKLTASHGQPAPAKSHETGSTQREVTDDCV